MGSFRANEHGEFMMGFGPEVKDNKKGTDEMH
jgi:hypothetical protein